MHVQKRDGRKEAVHFDKITARITKLAYGLSAEFCDPVRERAAIFFFFFFFEMLAVSMLDDDDNDSGPPSFGPLFPLAAPSKPPLDHLDR